MMNGPLFCVLALLAYADITAASGSHGDESPIVRTRLGRIRGITHSITTQKPIKVNAFYGVPYAQPPINELRFEKPKQPNEWDGVREPMARPTPSCVPHARPNSPDSENANYSEDCLYLNIFTPHQSAVPDDLAESQLFPVLMIIHGGGYELGSTIRYSNAELVGAKFVSRRIIVVAVAYRLGVLGFASSGESNFSGNYGLWDLSEALHFVHANIRAFGGDPDRITLYGHSAGAAAVSSLGISPHSRNQFKSGIQLSGSPLAARMTNARVVNETLNLANVLNCDASSSDALKKCLRQKSVDELFDAVDTIGPTRVDVNFVRFGPRPDGDFFPLDHPYLINEAPPKPTIMGFVEEEAVILTLLRGNTSLTSYAVPKEEQATFSQVNIERFVRDVVATKENFSLGGPAVARRIQDNIIAHYCNKDAPKVKDNVFYLQRFTRLLSDVLYVVPIVWESRMKAQMNWPLYLYWNGHINEDAFPADLPIKESFHGYDDYMLFPGKQFTYKWNERDEKVNTLLVDAIVTFVKDRRPSLNGVEWPRTVPTSPTKYLRITRSGDNITEIRDGIAAERLRFWLELMERYPEFNIIRGSAHPEFFKRDEL